MLGGYTFSRWALDITRRLLPSSSRIALESVLLGSILGGQVRLRYWFALCSSTGQ